MRVVWDGQERTLKIKGDQSILMACEEVCRICSALSTMPPVSRKFWKEEIFRNVFVEYGIFLLACPSGGGGTRAGQPEKEPPFARKL